VDSLKRVEEEARKLGIRFVQSVFEADAQVVWVQRLIQKRLDDKQTALSSSCQVIICDEHYTSKTCGSCGELRHKFGKNKAFLCPQGHYEADREFNAARNILLGDLTLNNIMFKRGSLGEARVSYAPTASHSVPVREMVCRQK